jgi:hypothetical protein
MEFIFALLGFIVLLGFGLAFAADKLREEGECLSTKPVYCCYCGNRLRPDPVTHATDSAVDADG